MSLPRKSRARCAAYGCGKRAVALVQNVGYCAICAEKKRSFLAGQARAPQTPPFGGNPGA